MFTRDAVFWSDEIEKDVEEDNSCAVVEQRLAFYHHGELLRGSWFTTQITTHCKNTITCYCEIIFIRWTFNSMFFVGRAIHEFKIPPKYIFTLVILRVVLFLNPRIQESTNMSIVIKPWNFMPMKWNDFTFHFWNKHNLIKYHYHFFYIPLLNKL